MGIIKAAMGAGKSILKSTYGAAKASLRKKSPVAKSYFDKGTALGRKAFKVARAGVAPVLKAVNGKHAGKIGIGIGAVTAVHAMQPASERNPLVQRAPVETPTDKPLRYRVQ